MEGKEARNKRPIDSKYCFPNSNLWSLDLCVMFLPQLKELLASKYKTYVQAAVDTLRLILREFTPVIKNGLNVVPSIGVDVTQEER